MKSMKCFITEPVSVLCTVNTASDTYLNGIRKNLGNVSSRLFEKLIIFNLLSTKSSKNDNDYDNEETKT